MAATQFVPGTSLDNRVEDYLDDKLQSTTDLDSLDELLASVELQRNQLQTQLDDALVQLEEARRTAGDRQGSLQARIADFQQLQESIDRREAITAASDAPDQAIARLQRPMKKLRAVELAQRYLVLVQDVERLRVDARSHLPGSPKAALEPYAQLKQLASRLKEAQGDEMLHLVDYVHGVTEALWGEMKSIMSAEFEGILEKRHWPMVDPQSEMDDEWITSFEKLIDLQLPEVLYSTDAVVLLPLEAMSKILAAEFRFHFLSDKPTSDPQAVGTHCFPWFLMKIEKWQDFFRDNLGHLLASKFIDTSVASNLLYVDPVCAFITAMLPVLREKVHDVARKALKSPSFLSNFISQLMTFDEDIRSRYNYDGGDPERGWRGLTTEILDIHFDTWFQAEKEFALERFREILSKDDARNIDYEYTADGRMKPTYAAVRITDLLRTVTGQYNRLRKVKHKISFLINIQIEILEEYDDRLRGSLEAYQSLTSTLGRTLHGVTKEQMAALEGTGALETLCKVIGSSDHVLNAMKEWSNEEVMCPTTVRLSTYTDNVC
jgi:RAD50-interacting protein 1